MSERIVTVHGQLRIKVPRPPNFVAVTGVGISVPVGSLTDEQLDQLAASMRDALFANAERQRKNGDA